MNRGDLKIGLDTLKECLKLRLKGGSSYGTAMAYQNIGNCYLKMESYDSCMHYLMIAKEIKEKTFKGFAEGRST